MRRVAAVTVARSDYGIYQPVLRAIEAHPELELQLLVSGMHLSPEFGSTHRHIEADGFKYRRVEMLLSSDTPEGIGKSMGLGTIGFAQRFGEDLPDILLVLGDRFEMHSAVVASLPFKLPVAHIHGGESTEGAMDDPIRHAITKMSHLHFVSTQEYGKRVVQMGEAPWRVLVTGAPSLDNLKRQDFLDLEATSELCGLDLAVPTLMVTFHPVTLEYEHTASHATELMRALHEASYQVLFTYPNADTSGRMIVDAINRFVAEHQDAQVVQNLGTNGYFSLMRHATAMVGNSSSGIIEAASFQLPVVNIGQRQRGRIHGRNVINVGYCAEEIVRGIEEATSIEMRHSLRDLLNPYGDGQAAPRITQRLAEVLLDDTLLLKKFHNLASSEE